MVTGKDSKGTIVCELKKHSIQIFTCQPDLERLSTPSLTNEDHQIVIK